MSLEAATRYRRFRGFSIVKVLIVLALLVATSLTIIALYARSLQSGSTVMLRTHAANLAAELAKRIEANPTAGAAYTNLQYSRPEVIPSCGQMASGCTPEQRAAADLFQWEHELMAVLPDNDDNAATPQWTLAVHGESQPRTYVITIYWSAPGEKSPLSYVLTVKI